MAEVETGTFIRWQSTTLKQLTYAVNLVLTFSVATLGFQVTTLLDRNSVQTLGETQYSRFLF
jgi:hypothetical protein